MVANEMNSGFGSVPSINGSVCQINKIRAAGHEKRARGQLTQRKLLAPFPVQCIFIHSASCSAANVTLLFPEIPNPSLYVLPDIHVKQVDISNMKIFSS